MTILCCVPIDNLGWYIMFLKSSLTWGTWFKLSGWTLLKAVLFGFFVEILKVGLKKKRQQYLWQILALMHLQIFPLQIHLTEMTSSHTQIEHKEKWFQLFSNCNAQVGDILGELIYLELHAGHAPSTTDLSFWCNCICHALLCLIHISHFDPTWLH